MSFTKEEINNILDAATVFHKRKHQAELDALDPLNPGNRCRDFDEDCEDVPCKLHCWLHDPTQGWCPYLKPGGGL